MHSSAAKTIFVTGASSGIGKAAALALLHAGFHVVAAVRSDGAADALRSAGEALSRAAVTASEGNGGMGARLETIELDVTNPEHIRAAAERLEVTVGSQGLWGLFNNAGISVAGPIEYVPIEALRRQLDVNVIGQFAVTQALLPLLRKAQGRVLTTGSISGFFAAPALSPYSMSKHAMEAFSDSLRREVRPFGVHVSLLEPGAIATDIWSKGLTEFESITRNPPPGLLETYSGLLHGLRNAAQSSASGASPLDLVTRDVVHAFTAPRPRTRYRMGKGSTSRKLISRLPDRWADALVAKGLRWG